MSDYGLRLEKHNHTALVILDRPERLNAFNAFMFAELRRITALIKKESPRAVVLTGAGGKAFSAGFDVNPDNPLVTEMYEAMGKKDRAGIARGMKVVREAVDEFVSLPMPIIAAINGPAYGGGAEISTRCDLRIMDTGAVICFSEVRLGLMPDWGGGAALAHLVGPSRAADLVLSARRISADEALSIGLVNRVSHTGEAVRDALALAADIAGNGPQAVRQALSVIRDSRNMRLDQSLDLEFKKAVDLVEGGECIYGITAFLEKRTAEFPSVNDND